MQSAANLPKAKGDREGARNLGECLYSVIKSMIAEFSCADSAHRMC